MKSVIERRAESYALGWHLSDYPDGTLSGDFDAILERIENDEIGEDITPFEDYERFPGYKLAESIESMKMSLINTFKDS